MVVKVALVRAWHVSSGPAQSEAARNLKVLILLLVLQAVLRIVLPSPWDLILGGGARFSDAVLMYAMLWFVRQRDEARAALKTSGRSSFPPPHVGCLG